MLRKFALIGLAGLAWGTSGSAQAEYFESAPSFVSEVRVGIFAHDVYHGFLPFTPSSWNGFTQIENINVELLFTSPDVDFMRWIGAPRPSLGGTFNLDGQESFAHLGLTWQVPVFNTPLFIETTIGGAVNNGMTIGATHPAHNMGCNFGFYESVSIGANVGDNVTVMLTYEHTSNLELCSPNEGMSNMGVRVGYKF